MTLPGRMPTRTAALQVFLALVRAQWARFPRHGRPVPSDRDEVPAAPTRLDEAGLNRVRLPYDTTVETDIRLGRRLIIAKHDVERTLGRRAGHIVGVHMHFIRIILI
jgi:hypothetical protein